MSKCQSSISWFKMEGPKDLHKKGEIEMFYLNTIDQLEVCLPYSRLLTGIIPTLAVFQNLRWNSNKTFSTQTYSPLCLIYF